MVLFFLIISFIAAGIIFAFTYSEMGNPRDIFYDSVNYEPAKGLLSFTIPKSIPKGYRFYLHVSGRLFMGDKSSGMSFHAFDKESQSYSWIGGKTYTYPLSPDNLDFIMLVFGLLNTNNKELLYEHIIYVFPDGSKIIYKTN